MNQAQRDGSIAEKSQAAAQKRLEAVGVELAAAKRGVFVGIGSNDRPRYMLRGLLRTLVLAPIPVRGGWGLRLNDATSPSGPDQAAAPKRRVPDAKVTVMLPCVAA
jgi:hypothetical protein